MSPFDILKVINETKEDIFQEPQAEKDYSPYMINRGLSYFPDTVMYANQMNLNQAIPKKFQFLYLLNSVPKRKRFSKWHKKDAESKSLALIKEYYNYSNDKAKIVLNLLTPEQLSCIEEKLFRGSGK
ncbi:clamp loader small subunit [uncultured Caudovirales phage]|uniref:Clamp loader small subunit n=1 Tax=uncultured Caudovirales phage TaxID=2100421 RepID=A0A6J5KWC2_9CAUD|nr:clamp loader small subunit [uncultured Caudovirales phage]